MRPLAIPALALALAACEPLPPQPEFIPVIAPTGAGVGLPGASIATTGTFAPDPISGPPIIEEVLTDVPADQISRPIDAPLDPSIGAAVQAAPGGPAITNIPPATSGPIQTLPLGTPLPDPPLATVPGGPLPDPQFAPGPAPGFGGSSSEAISPGAFDDSRAVPRIYTPPTPSPAVTVTPISAAPVVEPHASGLSDEQDFEAVQNRVSIESDAERLARMRAARQEIAPEPLPVRPTDMGPDIVRYAIASGNAIGEPIHPRSGLFRAARLRDACSRFASPDRAQEAFLQAGGPERDRHGLDPDGDGYACAWDPAPFRSAVALTGQ